MNILAFTDPHFSETINNKLISRAKDADIVVCAGDFTNFGKNFNSILKDFNKFKKPTLIVPGNHEEGEDFSILKGNKKVKFLHKKSIIVKDYLFFGYGYGGFSERYGDLEKLIPELKKRSKGKKVIFVTHAPVYGTSTDYIDWAGHVGSKSALKLIKEIKPMLVICGHIEENFNQIDHIGKTIIINPGDKGKILEV
jgi:uncharacterized protein